MDKYDYRKAMVENIKEYIKDNPNAVYVDPMIDDEISNYWYDVLWEEDCITGNGAFWYAKEDECEEFLTHNLDLALEACQEMGVDMKILFECAAQGHTARFIDCTIRCYLLGECLEQALEEINS